MMTEMDEDTSVSKYYQVIGEKIAVRRKDLKMAQHDLAEIVGLSRVHISNIEVGRCGTPITTLYKIADGLKTNIHELLPKDIHEIDALIVNLAIYDLAKSIGVDPVENEKELKEMIERINRMKEGKNE